MNRDEYLQKLKDPRWQQIRLKVFERDNWICQQCCGGENTLNVHRRYYLLEKEPWEYDLEALVTLCEYCHLEETENRPNIEKSLLHALKKKFLYKDLEPLVEAFNEFKPLHCADVIASTVKFMLMNEEIQRCIMELYFESITGKRRPYFDDIREEIKKEDNL
jgi:hypothetical protein